MLDFLTNEHIDAKTVRLIDDEKMIGVIPFKEALARARARSLDLVMVAAESDDIPVCRILDADRFRFERKKSEREQARKQRVLTVDTKEVQLRPVTNDNDLSIKSRKANGFLGEGDKVRVVVRFRGRERSHKEQGYAVLDRFMAQIGDHKVERAIFETESELSILLAAVISKADVQRSKVSVVAKIAQDS